MNRESDSFLAPRLTALAILGVAAGLRLLGLAAEPLSAPEAARAIAAWTLADGATGRDLDQLASLLPSEPSPLLESAHLWTAMFGAESDLAVRLPGALAGLALVALLLCRLSWVAPLPRLALAALVAVDPTLVAMSRRQGDVALGLLTAALVLLPLARRATAVGSAAAPDELPRAWALAAGCLLASGWVGWAMIPAMSLVPLAWPRVPAPPLALPARPAFDVGFVALGLGLASTAGLVAWSLLPQLSAGLTSFLGHLGAGCAQVSERVSVVTLVAADPIAFGLGPAALAVLAARGGIGRNARGALVLFAVGALVLAIVNRAAPEALGLAAVPLLIAVAVVLGAAPPRAVATRPFARALLGAALVVGAVGCLRQLDVRAAGPWQRILAPAADPEVRLLVADLAQQRSPDGRPLGHLVALELTPEPTLDWYLRAVDAVRVGGPERAATLGRVSAVLTRAGERPAAWIAPPTSGAAAVGREYRIGGVGDDAAEPIVLWRFVGGDHVD